MTNNELKKAIEDKTLSDELLVLKYSDNNFLCIQYAKRIAEIYNKTLIYVNSLDEVDNNSFFDTNNILYVYNVEKLDHLPDIDLSNTIIICKDIAKDIEVDYVDIIKQENWMIIDYAKNVLLPGLREEEIEWLCQICSYNIFRIYNEAKKINIFPKASQELMFNTINNEDGYSDLNPLTIFNFTNAIMKKDIKTIAEILNNLKVIDVEGTGVVTLLRRDFYKIISIQMNPKATAESLNMTTKQFNALRYSCGKYSNKQLVDIYEFLTSIDSKIKNGELQLANENRVNNEKLVNYITCNILAF